jgi:pimeloyl-ACP methyl ester carboxylesterase
MPSAAGPLPAGVEAVDVATARLRTHLLQAGPATAPVLVLLHGNVSSARFFAETMAALAGQFRCIAPDLRGFGGSQPAPVDARRGVRDFADDVHALLTGTGLLAGGQRVHLLGWSLGSGVALQYAIDHPGRRGLDRGREPDVPVRVRRDQGPRWYPVLAGLRGLRRRHRQPGAGPPDRRG